MKTLAMVLGVLVLLVGTCFAEDYEINITIKYNSLSKEETKVLIDDLMAKHGKACELEIKTKKINDPTASGVVLRGNGYYWDSRGNVYYTD